MRRLFTIMAIAAASALSLPAQAQTVTVTYQYKLDGKTVFTEKKTGQTVGAAYPDLMTLPAYVSAEKPAGTVAGEETKDVVCAYSGPVTAGKPYFIYFAYKHNNVNSGYLYENDGGTMATGTNTQRLDTDKGVWRFEGDPFNGYKIVSASGDKRHWVAPDISSSTNTGGAEADRIKTATDTPDGKFDTFEVVKPNNAAFVSENGFYLRVKGKNTWYCNSRDRFLAFYTQFANPASGGNGCVTKLVDALPALTLKTADNKDYYATYYLPFSAKVPEGFAAYGVRKTGTRAELSQYDGVVPANTGVLVRGASVSATFTLSETDGTGATVANDLVGTLTDKTDFTQDAVYIFSKKGATVGFYHPAATTTTLAANKAYMLCTSAEADVEGYSLTPEPLPTGVRPALSGAQLSVSPFYDLSGRRVSRAVKGGVYIRDGRKVVVR